MNAQVSKTPSVFARAVFGTRPNWTSLILRLTLAVVIFPHGAQKALGMYGGFGWSGTMQYFTGAVGLPNVLAAIVILIEFLAPFALVLGFFTRGAALGVIAVMLGAIERVHYPNGFFMNWYGKQAGEGFEYHLLVIGIALALVIGGAGYGSIDKKIGGTT